MTDLDVTKRTFAVRFGLMLDEYARNSREIEEAQAYIDQRNQRQEELRGDAQKLEEAALLLGFDLNEAVSEAAATRGADDAEPTSMIPPIPPPAEKAFSIKEWVLEAARDAYPGAVQAAGLRQRLRDHGRDIHDKTIGMTLYRWLKRGQIRREGINWYYVPEAERKTASSQNEEAERD